jgi:hypothetical protein
MLNCPGCGGLLTETTTDEEALICALVTHVILKVRRDPAVSELAASTRYSVDTRLSVEGIIAVVSGDRAAATSGYDSSSTLQVAFPAMFGGSSTLAVRRTPCSGFTTPEGKAAPEIRLDLTTMRGALGASNDMVTTVDEERVLVASETVSVI